MGHLLAAILPVFLLIFVGAALRRTGFLGTAFWDAAERLTYFVLLPCLLVATLAGTPLAGLRVWALVVAVVAALLVMTAALALLRPRLGFDGGAYSSLVQSALRSNTYVGLAAAAGLYGEAGLAAAAVAVGAIVPLVNLLSVATLARHGDGETTGAPPKPAALLGQILRNPLILACALGILLNATGLGLPALIGPMLEILGRGALPLGLLAVGAALDFGGLGGQRRALALAAVLKLLVLPAFTALVCWALGLTGTAAAIAILFNGLPTASSSYILARRMGGDAALMAGMITIQTGASVVTLPLVLLAFA